MKILRNLLWCLILVPMTSLAQNSNKSLLEISEITVKPGHDAQFREGVKLWKECYLKHKGTNHWTLWRRLQGKGDVYELTDEIPNWAAMYDKDPAGKECRMIAVNFIIPHVESRENTIAQNIPAFSRSTGMDSTVKLIWVTFFKVKNKTDFLDGVKNVSSAIKTTEGDSRGYWSDVIGGGPESPDFFVTEPYKGFADLDKPKDNPFKVYEKLNGKKAGDAILAKTNSSIQNAWSYIYIFEKDLSF